MTWIWKDFPELLKWGKKPLRKWKNGLKKTPRIITIKTFEMKDEDYNPYEYFNLVHKTRGNLEKRFSKDVVTQTPKIINSKTFEMKDENYSTQQYFDLVSKMFDEIGAKFVKNLLTEIKTKDTSEVQEYDIKTSDFSKDEKVGKLFVKADYNDGDYVTSFKEVSQKQMITLTPLLKELTKYKGEFPQDDFSRLKLLYGFVPGFLLFEDNFLPVTPSCEDYIHTIVEISLYKEEPLKLV